MQNVQEYDLIIVGAGMVGASLACALGNSALKIAIVDTRAASFEWKSTHDIRVSALTHASTQIFSNLGVWQQMLDEGACAYGDMEVWDQTGDGQIHFSAQQVGEQNLGHIVENRIIQKALQQSLPDYENIDFIAPFKPKSLRFDKANQAILESDDKRILKAQLLVGADGANSWVRMQAQIDMHSWDYEQHAVVAVIKTEQSHQNTCWQQFMPTGPLAFLPLNDNYTSIVWSTSPEQAKYLVALDEKSFNEELQMAFGSRLGRVELCSERGAFPLRLRHVKEYVRPGLALIGDAAHTVHPLAGQGVNLGLLDAACLSDVLLEAIARHKSPGNFYVLRKYERGRKAGNVAMLASMDMFKRIFSNDNVLLSSLRNLGLNMADSSSFIRNFFIREALGQKDELPSLAKLKQKLVS